VLARALAAEGGGDAAEVVLGGLLLEDPADTDAAVALADLLDHAGRKEEAFGVLLRPGDDPAGRRERFVRAWDLLDGVSLPGAVLARGEKACREVLGASPREAAADLLLGRILLDSGDPGGALAALDRAVANGARAAAVREDRLRAALGSGAFGRARRILEAGLPSELLREPGNTRRAAFERLLAALGAAGSGPERADRLAELARALSGMGFDREAADYAGRAVARAPERAGLEDLLSDLCAWRDFLGAVRAELHRRYLEFSASGGSATLSEMKAVLARISREHLGRDVVTGLPEESWPFVGAVARSDLTGAPPDWEDHGTVFVLGRRVSGPLEATMMRLVARFPARREAEGTYSLVVGEGQTLRSYFEEGAGRIAGFTLPGWVLMNLDVVNRWEAEVRSLAKGAGATPLWPAPDRVRRESLWFPAGVRERLAVEYIAAAGAKNGTFQSALCHEKGHLLEADRYLPVLTSLPSVLGLLIGHGFSVSGIEVQLERDAEIHALAVSPYPRNALIDTMAFLPHENSAPPHSRAYYGILRCLVREIARHPGRYPSIDPAFNVLEQLDRLSKEELAAAVQRSLSPD
jgi:tetratricopeptide (TPR) repeat protein